MKKLFLVVLLAAATVLGATPAKAISREGAAALGFIGGVVLAGAACASQPTYCETVVLEDPGPCGYYEYRTERVWVPGCWIWVTGPCHQSRRVWKSGHYRTENVRVWVEGRRGPPGRHGGHRGHRRDW